MVSYVTITAHYVEEWAAKIGILIPADMLNAMENAAENIPVANVLQAAVEDWGIAK